MWENSRIIRCCCCGKQCVGYQVPRDDKYCTIKQNGRAGFNRNEMFCGYCSEELDNNGLFPEERDLEYRF
jgi:hypothetical protein